MDFEIPSNWDLNLYFSFSIHFGMPNRYLNMISISVEEFTPHISGLVIKLCVHLAEC